MESSWPSRPRPGSAPQAIYSAELPVLISHKAALGSTSTCTDQPRYLAARCYHTEPERLLRPVSPLFPPAASPNGPVLSRLMSRCALKPVRGGGIGLITSSELIIFKTWWLCRRAYSDAAGAPCQRCTPPSRVTEVGPISPPTAATGRSCLNTSLHPPPSMLLLSLPFPALPRARRCSLMPALEEQGRGWLSAIRSEAASTQKARM